MKSFFSTSCYNKKSNLSPNLTNNKQVDQSESFTNFNNIQTTLKKPELYDPKCLQYQYNVEVEGVIFDVLAPCILLDEFLSENIEIEE
ncbi:unnamed protein product [Paramecium primaurelia]|uniref:Uncharacterized protein n=1 Tax=Paramecium primaurelia TaxID=5886 RepID=A0A8S1KRI8_PARPR|nr:unnamed protein product [Paramecium primaurelia]